MGGIALSGEAFTEDAAFCLSEKRIEVAVCFRGPQRRRVGIGVKVCIDGVMI